MEHRVATDLGAGRAPRAGCVGKQVWPQPAELVLEHFCPSPPLWNGDSSLWGDGSRHFPGAPFPSQGQATRTLSMVSQGDSPAEDCSCKCHQRWESKKGLGWTWLISGSSAFWEGECTHQDSVMHLIFSQQNCGEVWCSLWRVVDFLREVNNVA